MVTDLLDELRQEGKIPYQIRDFTRIRDSKARWLLIRVQHFKDMRAVGMMFNYRGNVLWFGLPAGSEVPDDIANIWSRIADKDPRTFYLVMSLPTTRSGEMGKGKIGREFGKSWEVILDDFVKGEIELYLLIAPPDPLKNQGEEVGGGLIPLTFLDEKTIIEASNALQEKLEKLKEEREMEEEVKRRGRKRLEEGRRALTTLVEETESF